MSCYACGTYGHKKNVCPQLAPRHKCPRCKIFGHYEKDCSINKSKLIKDRYAESQKKLQEQEEEDCKWLEYNMPNKNKILLNRDAIKNIITRAISHSFTLTTINGASITMYYHNGILISCGDGPLGRCIKNMSIDNFLSFVATKGIFYNLSYKVNDDDLTDMIFKLGKNGFIIIEETEYDGEYEYYLCNKRVMISYTDDNVYNSIVDISYKKLICEQYNILINMDDPNVNNIEGSINFIYR